MDAVFWLAVGAVATILTLCWLFVEKRILVTSGLAGGLWSWMALVGGDVTRLLESGARASTTLTSLRYLLAAMAILSLFAMTMYYFGYYPPDEERPEERGVSAENQPYGPANRQ